MIGRKMILAVAGALMLASALADTQTVNGVTWTYFVENGKATIGGSPDDYESYWTAAVSPHPELSDDLVIPSALGGYPVMKIGHEAFIGLSFHSIRIPASVDDCGRFDQAYIDEYIVDENNPNYCSQEGHLYTKDRSVLVKCSRAVDALLIPDGVVEVGPGACQDCHATNVVLATSVRKIGYGAFLWSSVCRISMPEGLVEIGDDAFWECDGLESVRIPASVQSIGDAAFSLCDSLVDLTVAPESAHYCVVEGALYTKDMTVLLRCSPVDVECVIPESVTRLGDSCFAPGDWNWLLPEGRLTNVFFRGDAPAFNYPFYCAPEELVCYVREGSVGWIGPATTELPDLWPTDVYGEGRKTVRWEGEAPLTHTVTFDLGEHGVRTGGGELQQVVVGGTSAIAPEVVSGNEMVFAGWSADFSFVIDDMTVCAQYRKDGSSDLAPQMALVLQIEEGVIVGHSHVDGDGGCVTNGVLTIPAGVASIGEYALKSMEDAETVVVPASVKSIGDFAFGWCANLRKVTFADRAGCAVSENAFVGTPWQLARKLTFGPGEVSAFTIDEGCCSSIVGRAVIAGVAGAVWEDFAEVLYRGNGYDEVNTYQCLTCDGIVDVEKTAASDSDDYSCWELPKINMAYWGGYVSKVDYPTEDAVADAYRANGCREEVFSWLEVPTNRIDWSYSNGSAANFNEFIVRHLKDGNALVELWTSLAGHGITCCGYACDESLELWEPGYLTGLFIVDSDNDMLANGGAANAPNRIAYSPVRWVEDDDECSGCYMIGNIWGLEWDYVYIENALWAKGAPVAEKIHMPFGYEMRGSTLTGFHGDLPAQIVLPRETESVGESAFDADYREVGALVSAALPEGVTNICQYAFWFCENLTTLALPASLESVADCSFTFCTALRTVYVAPGDTERIRNMLSESAYKYVDGELISTIDVSKITFIEGEHPDLTSARLDWAKEDAVAAIEAAANDLARDQSGWNAALTALVKDAEAAVMAATTPEAAEAAGLAGVARVKAFVNEVASKVTGAIANFELYEDVWIGFRRITAVGSEVWVEVLENGTCTAELSLGDWQVTVEARRKSDGAFYTVTESLTVTDGAATFDLVLPADEYLGNAAVDLSEAGQYADVGVGGLSAVARKSAEAEGKSVTYELKVADPELLIEREEKPVLRMMASARAVQASANVSAASIAAMRAAVDGLRQTAETVIADINRRVNILSVALSRSDDGGRTWSDVEALEDETVEVTIPLEIDAESDFAILRSDGNEVESVLRNVDNGLNEPETGSDESFRVEEGKVVMKISRFAVFAVVSGSPRERLYPDGDGAYAVPTAAVSYEGVLLRDGAVAGTVSASVSKPNVRKGSEANITLKVKTIEKASYAFAAKKVPLSGSEGRFVLDPSNKKSASLGAATVVFGGDSLTGSFANGFEIDAVRDVFKERGNEKRDRISRYVQKGRSWCIALASDAAELGYATLGVKVSANGKVNVSGYMGDDVRVSASAKAEIGQGWLAVPVAVYKKSGKTVKTFGCRVSLDEASGKVGIANATTYAGSGFVLAASGLPELKKKEMKAAGLTVSAGDALASRPDAVKLTYNEKSGAIGGTATWFDAGGKKKLAGKVYGVVIGRQGFGEVVVKNVGTFRFTLVLAE